MGLFRKKCQNLELDNDEQLFDSIDYIEVYLDDTDKPRVYKDIIDVGWECGMFMIETSTEKTLIHNYELSEIVIHYQMMGVGGENIVD